MKEQGLFDWLKENKFPDLIHSPETYDGFDCTSESEKLFIELKCRRTHYPDLLIEKMKYDFLLSESAKLGLAPWYINWTPEGIWAFPLLSLESEIEWKEKWLPSTTEFANKNNKMKLVGFIHIDQGFKLV
jgi:hypothetical protein